MGQGNWRTKRCEVEILPYEQAADILLALVNRHAINLECARTQRKEAVLGRPYTIEIHRNNPVSRPHHSR